MSTPYTEFLQRHRTPVMSLAVLLLAALLVWLIFSTEPTAERSGATRETAMLVEVTTARQGSYRPRIQAMGVVEPARDIALSPRVAGEVVALSETFTPGGVVSQGETLLRIDPMDFRHRVAQRRAELAQADADLRLEQGRVDVARRDYELLGESIDSKDRGLVLREPQLQAARSRVEFARAALEQAQLDLQRSTVVAPFDAQILSRNANVGSRIAPGDSLGRLVGREEYWVMATVPQGQLRWLDFADEPGSEGARVTVRNRTAWPAQQSREGRLLRLVGSLDQQTRMARVLIQVEDPLALTEANSGAPALMLGAFVESTLRGRVLDDVVRIERAHLRQDDTVWVMQHRHLDIRSVTVILRDARYAYITDGLKAGDQIVTSGLATVADGAPLRRKDDKPANGGTAP